MVRWLAPGTGAIDSLVTAAQHTTLGPALVVAVVLGSLPLMLLTTLITTLALVAVYSPHRTRRATAEKILHRLLNVFRPPRT